MCYTYIAFDFLARLALQDVESLDAIIMLLLTVLGVFAGFLGGLLGVGGGIIVVPILVLVFNLDTRLAVGTSLVMVIFTALSATFAYSRQRRIDWKVGVMSAVATVPGASIGAYATRLFSSNSLAIIFGLTILLVAVVMLHRSFRERTDPQKTHMLTSKSKSTRGLWSRRLLDNTGEVFEYDASIYSGLLLLVLGGLASGFLGIGGGLVVVPILTAAVGLPMHVAIATSMLTMIFTAVSGVSTHIMLGNVSVEYAIPLVVGILGGTQIGAWTAKRLKSASLERVFAIAVMAIGVVLIITRL